MPHIQVLPRVPSPLEEIMPYISQAAGDISKSIVERRENKSDEEIIKNMFRPGLTDMERIQMSLTLSPKRRDSFYSAIRAATTGEQFGFQKEREKRLKNADILSGYDKRISQINAELKEVGVPGEERKRLRSLKDNLVKEQAVNRTLLRGGKAPKFKYLENQEEQPQATEGAQEQVQQDKAGPQVQAMDQIQPPLPQQMPNKRIKWDPRNPEHMARREMILRQAGGNRVQANKLLAQEFDK